MKSSSLAALKVVKMTTFIAASDEDFVKMTTISFQCNSGKVNEPTFKPNINSKQNENNSFLVNEMEILSWWQNFHHWLHWILTTSSAASDENSIQMITFSFQ